MWCHSLDSMYFSGMIQYDVHKPARGSFEETFIPLWEAQIGSENTMQRKMSFKTKRAVLKCLLFHSHSNNNIATTSSVNYDL